MNIEELMSVVNENSEEYKAIDSKTLSEKINKCIEAVLWMYHENVRLSEENWKLKKALKEMSQDSNNKSFVYGL